MTKKIKDKKDLNHKNQTLLKKYLTLFLLLFVISLTCIGVYVYWETYQENIKTVQKKEIASSDELMRKMKQMLEEEKIRLASLPPVPEVKTPKEEQSIEIKNKELLTDTNETKTVANVADEHKAYEFSEAKDYENSLKEEVYPAKKTSEVVRKKYPHGTTPKLAIVIDDVSFPWQVRMMKEIPYKVNPAFFPPTAGHPETVRLSNEFEFAMIHLPLEAKHYSRPEIETLNVVDSEDVIRNRIKKIKKLFPKIVYYNNHTGGYFTSNYEAMDKLIGIMKSEDLIFVDSRTAPNSKAPEIAKKYNMPLLSRDVFLDNSVNKSEIREQLKKAVVKAKKYGYAIAIGHPHKSTLEVLRDSKDLLEGLEMVYVKDL